jgi:hypothetical protein
LALGISDVRAWLATLPPAALNEWMAYHSIEPWDVPREHWRDVGRGASAEMLSPEESLKAFEKFIVVS